VQTGKVLDNPGIASQEHGKEAAHIHGETFLGPIVSIIIPTFNRAALLQSCVESVQQQTFHDWELLLINDGSTDNTAEVLNGLAVRDPRIRPISNPRNLGLPATRNIGIRNARGRFVLFLEDDIKAAPDCLEVLLARATVAQKQNVRFGAIVPALILIQLDREALLTNGWRGRIQAIRKPCLINPVTGMVYRNFDPRALGTEIDDAHACSLFPREVFDEVGWYDNKHFKVNFLYEDTDMAFRIRKAGYKLIFEPRAVLHHYLALNGGCRGATARYLLGFFANHSIFVMKHYPRRALFMLPAAWIEIALISLSGTALFVARKLRRSRGG